MLMRSRMICSVTSADFELAGTVAPSGHLRITLIKNLVHTLIWRSREQRDGE